MDKFTLPLLVQQHTVVLHLLKLVSECFRMILASNSTGTYDREGPKSIMRQERVRRLRCLYNNTILIVKHL